MTLTEVYNRNAAYWNSKLYRTAYHRAYVRLFETLKRRSILGRPERVLDCGIGAGLLAESLIDAGERPVIYGVDLSAALLGMAHSKLKNAGVAARLAFADVSSLPYRNQEMDLVMSALVLEHVPDPPAAIGEMVRVLRHDGLLIVVATRSGAPDHYFRWKYRYRPYGASLMLEWLTEAGLGNVRPYELSGIAHLFARAYVAVRF
jgi:demethylmenaquinone methyltransferase/2-methoxy-6-polyprenyl-1,4-benzoquinol methylase